VKQHLKSFIVPRVAKSKHQGMCQLVNNALKDGFVTQIEKPLNWGHVAPKKSVSLSG